VPRDPFYLSEPPGHTGGSEVTTATVEHWERVYDVLVEECGAHPRDTDAGDSLWRQFIHYMNDTAGPRWWEFRFMGALGFGGKFHRDEQGIRPPRYSVSCYPEDRTEAIEAMIDRANARLAQLANPQEEREQP
jgi:hypothetical protein